MENKNNITFDFTITSVIKSIKRRFKLFIKGIVFLIIATSLFVFYYKYQNYVTLTYSVKILNLPSSCNFLFDESLPNYFKEYAKTPVFLKENFIKFPFVSFKGKIDLNYFIMRLMETKVYSISGNDNLLYIEIKTKKDFIENTDKFVNSIINKINNNIDSLINYNAHLLINSVNSTANSLSNQNLKDSDYKNYVDLIQLKSIVYNYIESDHIYYDIIENDKCIELKSINVVSITALFLLELFVLLVFVFLYDFLRFKWNQIKELLH